MSRSRPTSNPVSYHRQTKQYYVTRGGKRIYLGADQDEAIRRYHEMGLGSIPVLHSAKMPMDPVGAIVVTAAFRMGRWYLVSHTLPFQSGK
jgi:hypothetical protein